MKNLSFVLWMIGCPLVNTYSQYVSEYLLKNKYSKNVEGIASLTYLFIWFIVGVLLYEK